MSGESHDSAGLDPAAAAIDVAGRARELVALLVVADADAEVLAEVGLLLDAAIDRLRSHRRPPGGISPLDVGRAGGRLFGPVVGVGNPLAPPMVLERHADRVEGRCSMSRAYEGPRGYVHGGVSALLLDEVSAKVPELTGVERVTSTLSLRFRRPVPLEAPLLLTARRRPGERDVVDAAIAVESDPSTPLVVAEVLFHRLRPEQVRRFRAGSGANEATGATT
ncbi:MAG: hypothetical protein QM572_02555 [Nocardioides sp.]|uniref:PaaI family thioesterase n=1 Tax=Nocardioides sp. TaxID=35761 RepID=UPI0039E2BFEF